MPRRNTNAERSRNRSRGDRIRRDREIVAARRRVLRTYTDRPYVVVLYLNAYRRGTPFETYRSPFHPLRLEDYLATTARMRETEWRTDPTTYAMNAALWRHVRQVTWRRPSPTSLCRCDKCVYRPRWREERPANRRELARLVAESEKERTVHEVRR